MFGLKGVNQNLTTYLRARHFISDEKDISVGLYLSNFFNSSLFSLHMTSPLVVTLVMIN